MAQERPTTTAAVEDPAVTGLPARVMGAAASRWQPLLAGLLFLALSAAGVGAWSLAVEHHRDGLARQTRAVAEQFAIRIEEYFASRLRMAEYLRHVWSRQPEMTEADFRRLARIMLAKVSGIRAINWVDREGVIRWVLPEDGNLPAVGLKLFDHPVAGDILARAATTRSATASPPLDLIQGGHGFAVYLPLAENAARQGFLDVVFRIDEVFPAIWREEAAEAFGFAISDGEQDVYRVGEIDEEPATVATATAMVVDRPWTVLVRYYGSSAPYLLSSVPQWLPPVLTVVASALFAVLFYSRLRNIGALRQRERALGESEGRLRSFLYNSPALVLMKDESGRYTLVNNRLEEWFGLAPQAAIGRSTREIFDAETARSLGAVDRYVWETGETASKEHRKFFADGTEHILVSTKFPVHDVDGRRTAIGSFVTDVTEQRRIEAQLRQAQKMEAVGNMTGGLAHDFNNLLTIILGNLQMLDRLTEGESAEMVRSAIRAARRASEVTQRLLAFSRRHPLSPAATDLPALIGGFEGILQTAVGSAVELRVQPAPGLWQCHVDPSQLEVALINLAINARDAMPGGGVLTITMRNTTQALAGAGDGETASRDYVAVTMRDTGVGMPADVLEHAVEPFFTTKMRGKGTGLGLSMVYGFARQSGGDMQIRSAAGRGTGVTLLLPRAEKAEQGSAA